MREADSLIGRTHSLKCSPSHPSPCRRVHCTPSRTSPFLPPRLRCQHKERGPVREPWPGVLPGGAGGLTLRHPPLEEEEEEGNQELSLKASTTHISAVETQLGMWAWERQGQRLPWKHCTSLQKETSGSFSRKYVQFVGSYSLIKIWKNELREIFFLFSLEPRSNPRSQLKHHVFNDSSPHPASPEPNRASLSTGNH